MSIKINNLLSGYNAANAAQKENKPFIRENVNAGERSGKFDRLTISVEGKTVTYKAASSQKSILSGGINYSYNLSEEADKLTQSDGTKEGVSWQTKAANLNKAYNDLRNEIVQGYENGIRQVNVIDESSETGYRTLTMEEELNALDAAYEKNAKAFEELSSQQEKAQGIIGEWQQQTAAIKSSRPMVSSSENDEGIRTASDIIKEHSPETYEKIGGYISDYRNTKDSGYLMKASNLMLDWLHESYPKHPEWFGEEAANTENTEDHDSEGIRSGFDIMREHSPETADKMDDFIRSFCNTGIRSYLEKAANLAISWLKENYSVHPSWFK